MLGTAIAQLLVTIGADSKDFEKACDSAEKKFKKFSTEVVKAGKAMSLAVTAPIIAIGGAATKMAMDAVESESLFEVSMGRMADDARKWSEQIRNELGLNSYEVRKSVGTFNVMLTSMGLAEQQAYDMAKGLTKLANDMASFYNLEPEEAFEKLQSGISGEIEPLKRLGIVVNEATTKAYAYANGITEQGKALTEQEKILARYGVIMQQTATAQGDLARTMDSPSNQLRIMKAQIQELAIQYGQMLIPVLQKGIAVGKNVVDWLNRFDSTGKRAILAIVGVAAAVGPMLIVIGKIPIAFLAAVKGVNALASALTFLAKHPVVLVLAAIAAAAYGIYKLTQSFRNSTEATIKNTEKAIENAKAKQQQIDKAKGLVREYINLQQKTNKNNVDLAKMNAILFEIKTIMPELATKSGLVADAIERVGKAASAASAELKALEMRILVLKDYELQEKIAAAARKEQWWAKERDRSLTQYFKNRSEQIRAQWEQEKVSLELQLAQVRQQRYQLIHADQIAEAQQNLNNAREDEAKKIEDTKAAEETLLEVRRRNASEMEKLRIDRQEALKESKGPEHTKAINADYDDREKKLIAEQAKEEGKLHQQIMNNIVEAAEKRIQAEYEVAQKIKAIRESELQGYESYIQNVLSLSGADEEAEMQGAINTYLKGYRELQELAEKGEPVYNRWLALLTEFEKAKLDIQTRYANERDRLREKEEKGQLEKDRNKEQSNISMWERAIEVVNNYSDRLLRLVAGESAVRLAQLDRAFEAEKKGIEESIKDEKLKADVLAALDADYALRREEIHDEDRKRQQEQIEWIRERLRQMTGFTSAEASWRKVMESGAQLAFAAPAINQQAFISPNINIDRQMELTRLTELTAEGNKILADSARKLRDIDEKLEEYQQ